MVHERTGSIQAAGITLRTMLVIALWLTVAGCSPQGGNNPRATYSPSSDLSFPAYTDDTPDVNEVDRLIKSLRESDRYVRRDAAIALGTFQGCPRGGTIDYSLEG